VHSLNHTSDPVTSIEIFGQKQFTSVRPKTVSPLWDEVFIFNKRGLDKEEFEQTIIKITVMDSDIGLRYQCIGSYSLDASYVYFRKDHELHRTWIALTNEGALDTVRWKEGRLWLVELSNLKIYGTCTYERPFNITFIFPVMNGFINM
jgi:hypothetical protein